MFVTYVRSIAVEDQYPAIWRCETLAGAIQRTGLHQAAVIDLDAFQNHMPAARAACERADLIVLHRHLTAPVVEAVLRWKAAGKRIVIDLDQPLKVALPVLAPVLVGGPEPDQPEEEFYANLRLVDAITSPSARLLDDWQVPVPVFQIPDYLDTGRYMDLMPTRSGFVRIGLGGGPVPYASMAESGLLSALVQVCRQRSQVKLMIYGADASLKRYIERLDVPSEVLGWVPADEWPQYLTQLDVGLAPIAGQAERRKSWQRLLEYMIRSIPWVASDQVPYRALGRYGRLVANTEADWTQALLEVVDNLDLYRMRASREAFLFALGQDVDENIEKVIAQYRTILALPSS